MRASETKPALSLFHPLIGRWFRQTFGAPTEVQALAWPEIAAGRHVLVTAPTGSGKTLTAFLWALQQLLTGEWPGGRVRVLYVSPLRALNNDIRRNLLGPLAGLEAAFAAAGERAEPVRVATRSGDTPAAERQRMLRQPPEILITTPETLNILLTSRGGRTLLGGIACVLLDEIHAVAASKRGTHLITAVERLVPLAGEIQRVALSATVRPLERIARFVGGFEPAGAGPEAVFRPRDVAIVRSAALKRYDLEVRHAGLEAVAPTAATEILAERPVEPNPWEPLIGQLRDRIGGNRSTLLFANSRRTTEKLTRLINHEAEGELAYSHHGSLSREIRSVVERRLKEGRLKAIVATNSLELGIDIGALDEVVMLQTPPTAASAVQRLGRAGHGVGEVSRGALYPLHGRDYLDAAVMAKCVLGQEIEEIEPISGALDVLAQVILSMTAAETWRLDDLHAFLRSTWPYRDLGRRRLDLVIEMLAGRYADSRIRELHPRISVDRIDGTVTARRGAPRLIYLSGGTIPDRGYFHLRRLDSMAKLGELDEEFVWERSLGDTFALGAQSWRIQRITHNDVLVSPATRAAAMAPFWRAEERDRSFFLSRRAGELLETADACLAAADGRSVLLERLRTDHCMEEDAAGHLVDLLESQRAATGGSLPHRHHLLIERLAEEEAGGDRRRVILHTGWGGRVNRPWTIALEAAWEERFAQPLQADCDNDCLILELPRGFEIEQLFELVRPDNVEQLLRLRLERTGFFGARFRENAGRALLLPRAGFRRRVPLWLNRQRAKKLLAAVSGYEDFPVVVETWRTCLHDEFELESLKQALAEVAAGEIRMSEAVSSAPSPFAANLIWKQTNRLMYEDDVPAGAAGSALRPDLLRELVFSSQLRPRLPAELLDRFERKLQRTYSGYAPRDAAELLDWARERVAIPVGEWRDLLAAIERDRREEESGPQEMLAELETKVVRVAPGGGGEGFVCAVEGAPRILAALGEEVALRSISEPDRKPAAKVAEALARLSREVDESAAAESESDPLSALVGEWARFYGPFRGELLGKVFGLGEEARRRVLESLVEEEQVVIDRFREGAEEEVELEVCDAENLERLLRILRASVRPSFEALPLERLPLFLAAHQGLVGRGEGLEGLQAAMEKLLGYAAPAALWEGALLPARLEPYYPSWLDSLLQESDLLWIGRGDQRLTFGFPGELELLRPEASLEEEPAKGGVAEGAVAELFPQAGRRFSFEELARSSRLGSSELTRRLWDLAWSGVVSNTSFAAVRQGALNRFEVVNAAPRQPPRARRPGRRRFERWKASRPFAGDWFRLDDRAPEEPLDALDREESAKDLARLLLDRYGVVFRELVAREAPALPWSRLFRSLRLMELSGEVLCGQFFEGVLGLQFASRSAYRRLREGLSDDVIYWLSAADPASPCGLGLEDLKGRVPARLPSNHLVYHGARLVVTSKRNGDELDIAVPPDHPRLADYLGFLKVLLTRQFSPLKAIEIEIINGESAPASPYAGPIAELFSVTREHRSLRLRRRYG